jgi:hypothetical protein
MKHPWNFCTISLEYQPIQSLQDGAPQWCERWFRFSPWVLQWLQLSIVISTLNHRIQPLINQLKAIWRGPHPVPPFTMVALQESIGIPIQPWAARGTMRSPRSPLITRINPTNSKLQHRTWRNVWFSEFSVNSVLMTVSPYENLYTNLPGRVN